MNSDTSLLQVSGLTLATAGGKPLVHGIDFHVERGEIVALVGESGSGKTLSALSVLGLLPEGVQHVGGSVTFNGERVAAPEQKYRAGIRGSQIAMIFQEPMSSMNPVLTVGEQIAEVLVRHQGLSWKAAQQQAVALLDKVGIVDPARRAKQYIHQLSGGMRQRVMIASAISCKPALLIADEPTTALDVTIQAQILALLQSLQQEMQMGVLFITHDLSVVARYADRACVMNGGQIVEAGAVAPLLSAPSHPYTQKLIAASTAANHRRVVPVTDAPLISLTNVTRSYTQPHKWPFFPPHRQAVLQPTTLNIGRGEIVGLIGESGSGKTTLGRTAIGLIPADSGEILFDGINLADASRQQQQQMRRRAQIIFQDPFASLDPKMTVGEQIAEPLRVHKLRPAAEIPARINELLTLVGLAPEHAARLPSAFSGGQRQRIAIARALALEPELLVADEAVSALDLSVRGQVLALLADLRDKLGLTVLFISHDLSAVRQVCDRVMVMYRGAIVESGKTLQVLETPAHSYTRELLKSAPDIAEALRLRQG